MVWQDRILIEQDDLFGCASLAGEASDLGEALDERVVAQRLGGALLALAEALQTVGQVARDLGLDVNVIGASICKTCYVR